MSNRRKIDLAKLATVTARNMFDDMHQHERGTTMMANVSVEIPEQLLLDRDALRRYWTERITDGICDEYRRQPVDRISIQIDVIKDAPTYADATEAKVA
jgi:hypothetical protein